MADSIPSLRRKLAEAHARIAELEASHGKPRDVVRHQRIETVREVYVTDPALEATIRELQERLRNCTSPLAL